MFDSGRITFRPYEHGDKRGLEGEAGCAYGIKYKVQSIKYQRKAIILRARRILSIRLDMRGMFVRVLEAGESRFAPTCLILKKVDS